MHYLLILLLLSTAPLLAQAPLHVAIIADKGPHADYVQTLVEEQLQKSGRFTLLGLRGNVWVKTHGKSTRYPEIVVDLAML